MFDSIFGSMFGGPDQSPQTNSQLTQLYQLHATFRFATKEFLDGDIASNDGQGTQIQNRSMELYVLIQKTYIIDEYDYWGIDGKNKEASKKKVNSSTSNTMDACFALINNNKEEFDRLVKEGPTPDELGFHEKTKQRYLNARKEHLMKVASCEHYFGSELYPRNTCGKCGIKKEDVNDNAEKEK
jgi:hypothetical protein